MKSIMQMNYKELDEFMNKNRLQELTFRNESKIRRDINGSLLIQEDGLEMPYGCVTEFIR
ncbi:MAG: hypothetical protein VB095_07575 [Anaerovorax sp.]|nr:hypothetical protein [Anaerovorax sp.]